MGSLDLQELRFQLDHLRQDRGLAIRKRDIWQRALENVQARLLDADDRSLRGRLFQQERKIQIKLETLAYDIALIDEMIPRVEKDMYFAGAAVHELSPQWAAYSAQVRRR